MATKKSNFSPLKTEMCFGDNEGWLDTIRRCVLQNAHSDNSFFLHVHFQACCLFLSTWNFLEGGGGGGAISISYPFSKAFKTCSVNLNWLSVMADFCSAVISGNSTPAGQAFPMFPKFHGLLKYTRQPLGFAICSLITSWER